MRNITFLGVFFQLGLEAVISHVLIVPFLETPPQEPFQEGYLLAYGAVAHIFLVTQEVHIVIQTVLGERIKGKFIPELFQVVLYRSEFFRRLRLSSRSVSRIPLQTPRTPPKS